MIILLSLTGCAQNQLNRDNAQQKIQEQIALISGDIENCYDEKSLKAEVNFSILFNIQANGEISGANIIPSQGSQKDQCINEATKKISLPPTKDNATFSIKQPIKIKVSTKK